MDKKNTIYCLTAPSRTINCKITLPASKSISNRVLIINALNKSPFTVKNLSDSDDTRVLEHALNSEYSKINIGHAGTAMRFLTAYLSKAKGEWEITGSERMKKRPIKILVDALRQLGAKIEYLEDEGFPPLKIFGSTIHGGILEIDGSISSQYISAILMVAPTLEGGLILRLKNRITSRSYIEMTLKLMGKFGITHYWKNNEIVIPAQNYSPADFTVEADWSAASYWYQLISIATTGKVELEGLQLSNIQGDEAVASWFGWFGVETTKTSNGLMLEKKENIQPARIFLKFHETPDLAQTMAVLCVARQVPFHFSGLETLKIKETNRILALQTELAKLGAVVIEPREGELQWDGKIERELILENPLIETYNDHRMAMAFAPFVLTGNTLKIADANVVTKSYPGFWDDLKSAGIEVKAD